MHRLLLRTLVASIIGLSLLASGCASADSQDRSAASDDVEADESAAAPPSPTELPAIDEPADVSPPTSVDPEPYVPAGQPGTASAYQELVTSLEAEVPAELRSQVPWPNLRDPNPIEAQLDIFELWIWMEENHPDPRLAEIMSATGSPSRGDVTSIFGGISDRNQFHVRNGGGYVAFDHRIVTFESAGLPLWLTRDVPDGAVVVYYSDQSGPITVIDQDTGQVIQTGDSVPVRTWLSIMVATDAGWQLWRDQLIEPNNPELEVPDLAVPEPDTQRPPEL